MKFRVEIECDDEAFDELHNREIYHILGKAGLRVEDGETDFSLWDSNGHRVGRAWFEED